MQIHVFRPDLLGARLLNLAYGSALSELSGLPFQLHWPPFHKFADQSGYKKGNNLYDLFDSHGLAQSAAFAGGILDLGSFQEQEDWGQDLIHLVKVRRREKRALHIDDLRGADRDVIFSHVSSLRIDGIDEGAWHALARLKLQSLPSRAQIGEAEAAVIDQLPGGRLVAIHIRRGDIVRDVLRQTEESIAANGHLKAVSNFMMRYVPFESYRGFLRDNAFDAAMVFSDEEGIIETSGLRYLLPVMDVTSIVAGLSLTKIQKDFLEVKLMARGAEIIASQSRFPQLASVYAGRSLVDLSGRGSVDIFLQDLERHYGFAADHPVRPALEAALRRDLVES